MENQNEIKGLAAFNALKNEAKALGIDIKGLKKPEIEQAIRDAQYAFEMANQDTVDEIPEMEVTVEPITEEVKIEGVVVGEVKRLGRPVDPNSPRQIRLAEQERLRAEGLLKRGRPVEADSPRQLRLKAMAEKLATEGVLKRGRPKMVKPVIPPFVAVEDAAKAPEVGIAIGEAANQLEPIN